MAEYDVGKATKEKIVKTARRLFYENGYAETSCAQLAKEAGVKLGTLQYHYKAKDSLYFLVSRVGLEKNRTEAMSLLNDDYEDPLDLFVMEQTLYWYKFFQDSNYRRFVSQFPDLYLKNSDTLDQYYTYFHYFISEEIEAQIDRSHFEMTLLSLIGQDLALNHYICRNTDQFQFKDTVRFALNAYFRELHWDSDRLNHSIEKAFACLERAPADFLDYSFD